MSKNDTKTNIYMKELLREYNKKRREDAIQKENKEDEEFERMWLNAGLPIYKNGVLHKIKN